MSRFKLHFIIISLPYLAFIAYNQIEYNKLFQKIKTQEELDQAEQKLYQANSLIKFNTLFTDVRKSVYITNIKYRNNIIQNLHKATSTVANYTDAYEKAYNNMDYTKINALQSNITKKKNDLEECLLEAVEYTRKTPNDQEIEFLIQKGSKALLVAKISF